jgi:SNF2 family DNA or RNA helicase
MEISGNNDIQIEFVDVWPPDALGLLRAGVQAKYLPVDLGKFLFQKSIVHTEDSPQPYSGSSLPSSHDQFDVNTKSRDTSDLINLTTQTGEPDDYIDDDEVSFISSLRRVPTNTNLAQILAIEDTRVSNTGTVEFQVVFPQAKKWMRVPTLRNMVFPRYLIGPDRLKLHQLEGVKFLLDNLCHSSSVSKSINAAVGTGRGCILADVMGLGKTLTAVAALHLFVAKWHSISLSGKEKSASRLPRILIVAPNTVLPHWCAEINRCNNYLLFTLYFQEYLYLYILLFIIYPYVYLLLII